MSIRSRYWARISRSATTPVMLQHPVGQCGLAVVDVGDDAEVPNLRRRGEGLVGETADGNLLVGWGRTSLGPCYLRYQRIDQPS